MRVLKFVAFGVLCLLMALPALTQNQVVPTAPPTLPPYPAAPVSPAEKLPPGIAPAQPGSDKLNVNLKDVTLLQAIADLAAAAHKKVIFSDEMKEQGMKAKISLQFQGISAADLMDGLSNTAYDGNFFISWGTLGADTWMVIGRRIQRAASIVSTPMLIEPPPVLRAFPKSPQPKDDPGTPFWFNGHKYYTVPLH